MSSRSPVSSGLAARRGPRARAAILEAADDLLVEKGFAGDHDRGDRRPARKSQADHLPVVELKGGLAAGLPDRRHRSRPAAD